jgi:PAS domain S-box-containing protein
VSPSTSFQAYDRPEMTPALASTPSRSAPLRRALVTLLLGLSATAFSALALVSHNRELGASRFQQLASQVATDLQNRLARYEYALRGARGAALAAGPRRLDRVHFRQYAESRDLDREFPGAHGTGIVRRVAAADEAAFLTALRAEGQPNFAIKRLSAHDADSYVIAYVEPLQRNLPDLGFDLASEPLCRAAAEAAVQSGAARLTAPLSSRSTPNAGTSFLLLLPIYEPDTATTSTEQRAAATLGWSYLPLKVDEALADLATPVAFSLSLSDVSEPSAPFFVGRDFSRPAANGLSRRVPLSVHGRVWQADLKATPAFVAQLHLLLPADLGVLGSAASLLLAGLVYLSGQSAQRRAQARDAQARLAAIVESSNDAVIGESLDGIVTEWSGAAERLLGYSAAHAVGQPAASLLLPPERASEDHDIRAAMAQGKRLSPFDTTRRHADGRLLDVSVTASPILGASGKVVGFSKTIRDVSETKRAASQLRELNASLEAQVAERTAQLDAARQGLRTTLDAVPFSISYVDAGLIVRFANQASAKWFGRSVAEMVDTPLKDVLGTAAFEARAAMLEGVLAGVPQRFEAMLTLPEHVGPRHTVRQYLPNVVGGEVRGFYVVAYDDTEQEEAQRDLAAALRDNQALLRAVEQHAIVSVTDPTDRIVEVNDNFCKISGYSRAELVGQRHSIVNSGAHPREFWVEFWETVGAGRPWRGEICNRNKDGSLYWVDAMIAPFADENGRVQKYISIHFDITPTKLAETELLRTNERMALAADSAGIGVWEFDVVGNSLTWDDWMYRLYGRRPSDAKPAYELWSGSLHPDDRARSERELGDALAGRAEFDTEFRIVQPDGQVRYLKAFARVLRDDSGAPRRMVGVNLDVTVRKRAELELRETSSLLGSVLDAASQVSIVATDPQLNVRMFNVGAELLTGYAEREVVGRAAPALIHDPDEVATRAAELSLLSGERVEGGAAFVHPLALHQPREWTYRRKDGTRVPVSLTVTAMKGPDGELFGYLGVAHDVTRQREHEASLREATRRAEEASRAKSEFLANMSHEIRTPLNAVIGLSYLLGQTALDSEQAATLSKVRLAGKALLALVNDTLDFSKIEAGELKLERVPFHLRSAISEVQEVMIGQAEAKGIAFEVRVDSGVSSTFEGDATRVKQIAINLVSNAIKFTTRGKVELRISQAAAANGQARLRVEVEDTGIGISPADQARLFAPFIQGDTSTTRRFGGTGLGLSIVKRLAELMGGDVGVESRVGVGSTFWANLPLDVRHEGEHRVVVGPESATRFPLLGVRILVADDSDINLEVAKRILELAGAQVTCVSHGQMAVDRLRQAPTAFDVVLMDVQMPVLDGHAASAQIRDELKLSLPIIALTADARSSERQRCLASGMVDFVSKPFDVDTLVRAVRRRLPSPGAEAGRSESRSPQPPSPDSEWPLLVGIDTRDARERLAGDSSLFLELLARLLSEFGDLAEPRRNGASLDLHALGARAHKLRGSAGQIGALELAGLAAKLEVACREGDSRRATALLGALARSVELLRADFERVRVSTPTPTEASSGPAGVPPLSLHELRDLLEAQNLAVVARFAAAATAFRATLGSEAYVEVRDHIKNLRFREALALVELCTPGVISTESSATG